MPIPLSHLQQYSSDQDYFTWDVRLPEHLDTERIMVHTTRIEAVGRVAGLGGITLSEYSSDRDLENPGIVGANPDGTAVAASRLGRRKNPGHSSSLQPENNLAWDYQSPFATLRINRTAIVDTIIDKKNANRNAAWESSKVSDEQLWARELNRAYGRAFRRGAAGNLMPHHKDFFCYIDTLLITAGIINPGPVILPIMALVYALEWSKSLVHNKRATDGYHLSKKRLSFWPHHGFQPDRFVIAAARSALPVIRYRK